MEKETLTKVFENEIISNIRHKNLSPYEMAQLIDEYLKSEQAQGRKLEDIEKNLGITKRVLYKYRSILKLPKETIDEYKDTLSFEQMSVITYSVRDKDKVPEVLRQAAEENIPSKELVYRVAEINDKSKVSKHIKNEVARMTRWAKLLKVRVNKLPVSEQKQVREMVEEMVNLLNAI